MKRNQKSAQGDSKLIFLGGGWGGGARWKHSAGEVLKCLNDACDLDFDLEMRSKLRGHEISISNVSGNA